MYRYAIIDGNGYIVGISYLSGEVLKENMIPIEVDFDTTNKKWNGSAWESYTPPEPPKPEPTIEEKILAAVEKSQDEVKREGASVFKSMGAAMTFAMADAGLDVPPEAGAFAETWNPWEPDGETAPAKSLWKYQGVGYQARTEVQKIEEYALDKATNNYAVRPIPDAHGVFPGMLNMDVSIGMKVRDWEDGKVYLCYANPITSLQWPPHKVEASFILYEEGK